ncbi:hypothetical protein TetV_609 [Tetraselmis virus 1]|uniref:Uncharacterized protein n=1 Tax=Tetraselmis virus 1 TaxID=2060617 RepID=A0A2P0VP72_9VIRU|nr:hypothetical protein QJ968_gp445 [Tetraselmis virus 1]AUF82691.1 hypothetical protein TetV_609 [Tetraselmis virus 1]
MPSLKPIGINYPRWMFALEYFKADQNWIWYEHDDDRIPDYYVTVGIEGNSGDFALLQWKAVPNVICFESQPYGVKLRGSSALFSIMMNSYSYSCYRPLKGIISGEDKWIKHSQQFNLPDLYDWNIKNVKTVVLCCAKCGGWRYPTVKIFVKKFIRFAKQIRDMYPDYTIIIRPHPKVKSSIPTGIVQLKQQLFANRIKYVMSTDRMIENEAKKVRAAFCSWGKSGTKYAMHGIPVFDLETNGREDFVCDPITIKDLSKLKSLETYRFSMSPRDFMMTLAEHTFTSDELQNGSFMQYMNQNLDASKKQISP